VFKVGPESTGKIFAYLHGEAGVNVSLGLKLPTSGKKLVAEKNFVGQGKRQTTAAAGATSQLHSLTSFMVLVCSVVLTRLSEEMGYGMGKHGWVGQFAV